MKVTTTWKGGKVFSSKGDSGYEVNLDAPTTSGGLGKDASPTEMLLSSLAGCIGISVTSVLRPYMDKVERIEIETDGTRKEEYPKGFTDITVTFRVDGEVDSRKVWRAIQLGDEKYCAVSDSLSADISYKLVLNGEEAAQ